MSIEEIKDINKLKQMLKSAIEENKYLKECCIKVGEELAKNSFEWDGKEKNLVVQAMQLNDRYDQLKAENELQKAKLTGLACFYETNKDYDKSCIERAKTNKCLHYGDNICRLDDIDNNPNRDCLRCIRESYLRLYSLNWDNQDRLIKEYNKLKQAISEIKEVAEELLQTKIPFCTIHEKIMEIINEVEQ